MLRPAAAAPARLTMEGRRIESPLYSITLDADGAIERLFDKRSGREVVPAGSPANALRLHQDGPEGEAAWNVHLTYESREYPWDPGTTIQVVEQGPVRLVARVSRRYRKSTLEQDIVVWADCGRIDFVTRMDWSERQVMLKACFPVEVKADQATYEIQFGAVHRATHRNTSWEQEKFEVCAHRWMDLSEPGYGVSLLNDGRYGCDTHGRVMRLTLLRGPEWPDPEADKGRHELVYSLLPHAGDWAAAGTVHRAWELNAPVIAVQAGAPVPAGSFLDVSGPGILQTLKRAEDGKGWILRIYEPHGGRGTVTVTAHTPFAVVHACNHVEEGSETCAFTGRAFSFPVTPFQVRTFRIAF
jgi:alpha-mannosidase